MLAHRTLFAVFAVMTAFACGGSAGGCAGLQAQRPGTYQGPKVDSAGAFRISQHGFNTINANSSALLTLLAPDGNLDTTVSCSTKTVLGADFAVGDQGTVGCTDASCGRGDGICDARDVPQPVSIAIGGLVVGSNTPDVLEAKIIATVKTGQILIASEDTTSPLCIFSGGGQVKCTIDFDSTRKTPITNEMTIQIKLAIRNGLLSIETSEIVGTKACGSSGAGAAPACIDPADILIARESGGCDVCGTLNSQIIKQLLVDELTKSLKEDLTKSIESSTCEPCSSGSLCPTNANCVLEAGTDAGRCIETAGGLCSPRFLGVEGRADVSTALGNFGVSGAAIDLSVALGGSTSAAPAGASIGMRGGMKEVTVASCVKPLPSPVLPNLPLPNFDLEGPAGYDVAFSLSQQLLSEAMFHAQQSGALCLEVSTSSVPQLESGALETFLPSLKVLTEGNNVPLRLVIRPVNPPTVVLGQGTLDANGKPLDPLIRLSWPGLEIDIYAQIEEQMVRLFTISADLELPLGLDVASCTTVKPVIGDLKNAVKKVEIKNSELLAEDLEIIGKLVPTLISLAEPSLAKGLPEVTIPSLGDTLPFGVKVMQARGVGQISGTTQYNHLGIYAGLVSLDGGCQ